MQKSLGSGIVWRNWEESRSEALALSLRGNPQRLPAAARVSGVRSAAIPFYRHHELVEVAVTAPPRQRRLYFLYGKDRACRLDGRAGAIHEVNAAESLALDAEHVEAYLRLFTYFVRGSEGPFTLIGVPGEIQPSGADPARLEACRKAVKRPRLLDPLDDGRYRIAATVAYGGTLFEATFAVRPDGEIEMIDDVPIGPLDGLDIPALPDLALPADDIPAESVDLEAVLARHAEGAKRGPSTGIAAAAAPATAPAPKAIDDRSITGRVVSVLLGEAIQAAMGHRLLQRFNSLAQAQGPIGQLTHFIDESAPIILIESEIPFAEEMVADLVNAGGDLFPAPAIERASAVSGDDSRCSIDTRSSGTKLHLVSFHAYRSLWDAEWTAHQLAIGTATVFIGCDRRQDVPEPLRRVTDLVLRLPRIEARLFPAIFRSVFGAAPPASWQRDGGEWTRYLLHTDFHAPLRLRLTPAEAVAYLRERCAARLAQVSVYTGPPLDKLHGLGEARQVAEDLIADIAAARAGRIPWSAVDRGLLLAGAPGTGKTTLARAIAHACDVKFVHASATAWQSAGGLDMHLRAMRETFAEARRYAPAILFIDELDSIGNRQLLEGSNAVYQTDVINGLLEQIQGLDPEEPVMVIGATNFAERIDPALRRAGRLDQVVNIPLPNVAGLAQIFAHYLEAQRKARQLARDVDAEALARLAVGSTGADVEFFVRGAARRARKAGRRIAQDDLVAEVTRRPRRQDSAVRLTPAEMHRIAVHEAGHALAALLSTHSDPADLSFVTIVPRLDGSLGFTASVPPAGAVMTRRQVLDRLRRVLAGRAAEELVFGRDHLSLSSGGGETSDLAVATRIATHLVCMTGLGGGDSLHWTATPTPAQLRQVNALLKKSYREAVTLLKAERAALERIAAALVEHQELTGEAVRDLAAAPVGTTTGRPRTAARARPAPGKRRRRASR